MLNSKGTHWHYKYTFKDKANVHILIAFITPTNDNRALT